MKAWQPILTPKTVLPLLFGVGIIFAPIGGLLLWASSKVQEISIDYSKCTIEAPDCSGDGTFGPVPDSAVSMSFHHEVADDDKPTWCKETNYVGYGGTTNVTTPTCRIQFYVPDELKTPVLLYYQLTNFYQNHRRYVKSFDQAQLNGEHRDNSSIDASDCDPLQLGEDGKAYYPCGLIANSMFNDTIFSPEALNWPNATGNFTYEMKDTGIAWSADKELYKKLDPKVYPYGSVVPPMYWREKYPVYNETFPYPDLHTDEAFQVWMRTAGLPTFSKLSRRNDDLTMEIGRYEVKVYDCEGLPAFKDQDWAKRLTLQLADFPVRVYDGTKSILLSTRTIMGGRNPFLGIAYVVVGGICIILGALFTATHLIKPRLVGILTWLENPDLASHKGGFCSLTSGKTMTGNSVTTVTSAGIQTSQARQLQPVVLEDTAKALEHDTGVGSSDARPFFIVIPSLTGLRLGVWWCFRPRIGAKKGTSESRRRRAMYVHPDMNVLTIQKSSRPDPESILTS